MASRFWAAGSSSEEEESDVEETSSSSSGSSSDSDSSSGSSSSSETSQKKGISRFMVGSSDSDSEDDRRVVRSAKDRRFDELKATCEEIRNKMAINDWSAIQTLFDKLNKQLEKAQKVTESLGAPRVYVRILVELEDAIKQTMADKKKMSPTNTRAFNTMRQRLKKHNLGYQEQIDKYREHPESTEEEASEASESESESDSDEEAEEGEGDDEGFEKIKSRTEKKRDKILTMDPTQVTYDMLTKKLKEVVMARGKKGVDRQEQVDMLVYLASIAKGPVQRLEILIQVVSALFDINPSMSTHMSVPLWKRCVATLLEILQLVEEHPHIHIDEAFEPPAEDRTEEPPAGEEVKVWGNLLGFLERLDDEMFKSLQVIDPHTNAYLDRMRDEPLFLALAQKVTDYFTRSQDTRALSKVALRRMEHFYYKTDAVYGAMRKLCIQQQQETATQAAAAAAAAEADADEGELEEEDVEAKQAEKVIVRIPADFNMDESLERLMMELSSFIYRNGDERTKARAMLCMIYFDAIHDHFYRARDSMLMSHLQDHVQHMDISTQILFNRTMAQLGLAAFRAGLIPEAQSALSELYASGRVKELLAQGMSMGRYQDKTPEQEKLERRRQMPFHMHINLELSEAVHLIAAMLLEVPNMTANSLAGQRNRVISKPFRRLLDNYDRQTFTGPPENVRDYVMAATKALTTGQWERAYTFLTSLSVWTLIGANKDAVLGMLKTQVQQCGLKTYLLAYGNYYSSLSLAQLTQMFQLPEKKVHSVVSKMIMDEQLAGSWDQPTGTVVMHNAEPSRLQSLAMEFADRAATMVDLNERALTLRTGGLRDTEDDGGRGYDNAGFGNKKNRQQRGNQPYGSGGGGRGDMRSMGGRGNFNRLGGDRRQGDGRYGGRYDRNDRYGGGGGGASGGGLSVSQLPERFQRTTKMPQNVTMTSLGQGFTSRGPSRRQ
jgi:translation initiation factor 3 subunit C